MMHIAITEKRAGQLPAVKGAFTCKKDGRDEMLHIAIDTNKNETRGLYVTAG